MEGLKSTEYLETYLIYTSQQDTKTATELNVISVTRNNTPENYHVTKDNNYIRIKIGDANKTISGEQSYRVTYGARGILRSFEEHDELYWNITGNDWEVPVQKASAVVNLPTGGLLKIACFEGALSSTDPCISKQVNTQTAQFNTSRPLELGEGLTIVAGYQKGLVPIIFVEPPSSSITDEGISQQSLLRILGGIGIANIVGVFLVLLLWWKKGRDLKPLGTHETIVVEYTPPEKLKPAELGVLVDERADTLDITATIVDLAGRGYLTITEDPKKWVFGKTDYILEQQDKTTKGLASYEEDLLLRLFEEEKTVKVSELKNKFYADLAAVKKKLYEDVIAKKLFPNNPENTKAIYMVVAIVMIAISMIVPGALLLILSRSMARRTAEGRELYRRARGYGLFIEKAEKYRQQYFEKKNLFNEVLPYAIVFGLTEKFARGMKDIGLVPPQPSWYHSSGPFNAIIFATNINSFSNSMSSAIASSPNSGFAGGSSGFSGGSTGGGGGGGGGGSW